METSIENNAASYKIVAVVNKNIEHPGVAMNTVAHLAAGLTASCPSEMKDKMSFIDFVDKDGFTHTSISALSLVVLRATSGQIANLRKSAQSERIHHVDFLESMTGDTYKEQLENTASIPEAELSYYGIALFGTKEQVGPLTKKFSLWK